MQRIVRANARTAALLLVAFAAGFAAQRVIPIMPSAELPWRPRLETAPEPGNADDSRLFANWLSGPHVEGRRYRHAAARLPRSNPEFVLSNDFLDDPGQGNRAMLDFHITWDETNQEYLYDGVHAEPAECTSRCFFYLARFDR